MLGRFSRNSNTCSRVASAPFGRIPLRNYVVKPNIPPGVEVQHIPFESKLSLAEYQLIPDTFLVPWTKPIIVKISVGVSNRAAEFAELLKSDPKKFDETYSVFENSITENLNGLVGFDKNERKNVESLPETMNQLDKNGGPWLRKLFEATIPIGAAPDFNTWLKVREEALNEPVPAYNKQAFIADPTLKDLVAWIKKREAYNLDVPSTPYNFPTRKQIQYKSFHLADDPKYVQSWAELEAICAKLLDLNKKTLGNYSFEVEEIYNKDGRFKAN